MTLEPGTCQDIILRNMFRVGESIYFFFSKDMAKDVLSAASATTAAATTAAATTSTAAAGATTTPAATATTTTVLLLLLWGRGSATDFCPAKGESLAKVQLKIGESSPCHI